MVEYEVPRLYLSSATIIRQPSMEKKWLWGIQNQSCLPRGLPTHLSRTLLKTKGEPHPSAHLVTGPSAVYLKVDAWASTSLTKQGPGSRSNHPGARQNPCSLKTCGNRLSNKGPHWRPSSSHMTWLQFGSTVTLA